MDEVDFIVRDCVYMFCNEVPDILVYFLFCSYLLRYNDFLLCCLFQEVFIDISLHVFVAFNNGWYQVLSLGVIMNYLFCLIAYKFFKSLFKVSVSLRLSALYMVHSSLGKYI